MKRGIIVFAVLMMFVLVGASSSYNDGPVRLNIGDDTDSVQDRYSGSNIYFYANYSNFTSGETINNSQGNCSIRFNATGNFGSWQDMVFNISLQEWIYNRTFNYKGVWIYEVNCSGIGQINLSENYEIANKAPNIYLDEGGSNIDINNDGLGTDHWYCTEDILCIYNFSANVTDPDLNDDWIYNYTSSGTNTTLSNFTLNSSTGILLINITRDSETGADKKIQLTVRDTESPLKTGILHVNITPVNDPPRFLNLQNTIWQQDDNGIGFTINAEDEEENYPLSFDVVFDSCVVANWSDRSTQIGGGPNCTLFSYWQDGNSTLKLNVSTGNNFVGNYTVNFTVSDSTGKNITEQVLFRINNTNDPPVFNYVCDNERNATENSNFGCWINATDVDELGNLSFIVFNSTPSWFLFNGSENQVNVSTSNQTASAFVNFTPTDSEVGNWSIGITVTDSGDDRKSNTTEFNFSIKNVPDVVTINSRQDYTAYQGNFINDLVLNATDDDLRITQSGDYLEDLSFSVVNLTDGASLPWISVREGSVVDNLQNVYLDFSATSSNTGNYTLNVSVTDNSGLIDSTLFNLSIIGNNIPYWNSSLVLSYELNESQNFYDLFGVNLSEWAYDSDGDELSFTHVLLDSFPGFTLSSGGIINFTGNDSDVGFHEVRINVSDGKTHNDTLFNFTINNVNDIPTVFELGGNGIAPGTIAEGDSIRSNETYDVSFYLFLDDDDLYIPSSQVLNGFYNESFNVSVSSVNSSGDEVYLFNFTRDFGYLEGNRVKFDADFVPNKSQVGAYNVTINITDGNNASVLFGFNYTITEVNNFPSLESVGNYSTAVNRQFYLDFNATDVEDGNDNLGNLIYGYSFLNDGRNLSFLNSSNFNVTAGIINLTFNLSQGGKYHLNISVNDSGSPSPVKTDSIDFWIYVYDFPNVSIPDSSYVFNLQENESSNLTFNVNHSMGTNLTYIFNLDSEERRNINYYGNSTNYTWIFSPNFSDETYGEFVNLSLIVYPVDSNLENASQINTTIFWNVNITHKNYPITNYHDPDLSKQATYNQAITINLTDYFNDIDHFDVKYNQSVNFSVENNHSISYDVDSEWVMSLSYGSTLSTSINITGFDYNLSGNNISLTNDTYYNIEIEFTEPETETVTQPTSGGGGGSSQTKLKHYSLRIIVPDNVIISDENYINVPFTVQNTGDIDLFGINLSSVVNYKGQFSEDLELALSNDYIEELKFGESKDYNMTIFANTKKSGSYKATIFANVSNPQLTDWGDFYIELRRTNESEAEKILVFTEKLLADNPECLELTELIKEAQNLFDEGDFTASAAKSQEAISACEESIEQGQQFSYPENDFMRLVYILIIAIFIMLLAGIGFYFYKRAKFNKVEIDDNIENG